jgi:flavin reductase (DIM6/NTAB) family NADH-FMN oxidoreductase RutF
VDDDLAHSFREAMAGLAAGVAVVTARRPDEHPCGLVATSVSSFSANPPSMLVSVAHTSRCYAALTGGEAFGVHVLSAGQEPLARIFAGLGDDKFAGVDWRWDEGVPHVAGALSYLRCRRSAVFEMYDHTLLVGDVTRCATGPGDPLVYMARSMGWRLEPSA